MKTIARRHFNAGVLLLTAALLLGTAYLSGCRKDPVQPTPEEKKLPIPPQPNARIVGMYLLNEGAWGSNKASLDYLDFTLGKYTRNIYAERNPEAVKELGDVGNDAQIYGGRLYLVINSSHKVEVLDKRTAKRIGQVEIPNCRYIGFSGGKAYVSSYVARAFQKDQKGAIYELDTATLQVTNTCEVGYQPEGLAIEGDLLYVANSGGYQSPDYSNTVSVVRLSTMSLEREFTVGTNPAKVFKDKYGKLWITSRGNYSTIAPDVRIATQNGHGYRVTDSLQLPLSGCSFTPGGDTLLYYSSVYSNDTKSTAISYGMLSVKGIAPLNESFITDGTESEIVAPYGMAVNPETGDILIADAKDYKQSGELFCYNRQGRLKWRVQTGDIPGHMAFVER
jgi:hypothetical protein